MTEKEKIAAAVGNIPSGLFIVCSQHDGDKIDGFLGSWVQQVSFDPLRLSLCIKPGRPSADQILSGNNFSINVVGDHDKTFLKHFWSGYDPEKNPFAEIPHEVTGEGFVNIKGAKSTIHCKMVEKLSPGDHDLVICDVLNSTVHNEESKPMIHLRKSGLSY